MSILEQDWLLTINLWRNARLERLHFQDHRVNLHVRITSSVSSSACVSNFMQLTEL